MGFADRFSRRYLWFFEGVCLCFALGAAAAAQAYVLPAAHVLELMTRGLGSPHTLLVEQKCIFYDDALPGGLAVFDETARYLLPSDFRADLVGDHTQRTYVSAGERRVTVLDGRRLANPETPPDRYADLLLYRSRPLLVQRLAQRGLDLDRCRLERFQGRIAYVIGSDSPAQSGGEIWVDKETFRPLRWCFSNPGARPPAPVFEIRYQAWQATKGIWYPERIEFYDNDQLVREIVVSRVSAGVPIAEALFDVEKINATYPTAEMLQQTPADDGSGEVQQTIEAFKKILQ